ncbi:MAG: hypothetical protein PHE02_10310 [Lachnospiraceae bacterium]|nr:hypothetical protein [Lachnospiraceae bacterium]
MSVFSIIILIYVVVAIAKAVKANQDKNTEGTGSRNINGNGNALGNRNTTVYKSSNTPTWDSSMGKAAQPVYSNRTQPTADSRQTIGKVAKMDTKVEQKPEEQMTTVDYLAQKAEKEQQNQDNQARIAKMNTPSRADGRRMAVRLFEGDLPPAGTRVIKCNYCGAENLVPQNSHDRFACFFCREDLS